MAIADAERRRMVPATGARLLLDRLVDHGARADYAAWVLTAAGEHAYAAALADDGPRTNPGPWCDRCSYRSLCPASQERWEPVYFDDDDD